MVQLPKAVDSRRRLPRPLARSTGTQPVRASPEGLSADIFTCPGWNISIGRWQHSPATLAAIGVTG